MDLGLSGKTVVITAGGSAIGRAVASAFAKEGCNIVVADSDEAEAQKVVREVSGLGRKAMAVKADVTDLKSVAHLFERARAMYRTVDVLVNDSDGIKPVAFGESDPALWRDMVNINYLGALNCIKAVLPQMIERRQGVIVNVSTESARGGESLLSSYAGAKAAAVAASKSIAREVGRYGIRINVVSAGIVPPADEDGGKTNMAALQEKAKDHYPLRRLGKPEEIASAVVFLASDGASFITGQVLSVNGGATML